MDGLGVSYDFFTMICKADMKDLDAFDQVDVQPQGGNRNPYGRAGKPEEEINHNIIMVDSSGGPEQGTSCQYSLRKLRKSAPEYHARVLAGELSPHAAMIQAGFRKKTMTLPCDVESLAQPLRPARPHGQLSHWGADPSRS